MTSQEALHRMELNIEAARRAAQQYGVLPDHLKGYFRGVNDAYSLAASSMEGFALHRQCELEIRELSGVPA